MVRSHLGSPIDQYERCWGIRKADCCGLVDTRDGRQHAATRLRVLRLHRFAFANPLERFNAIISMCIDPRVSVITAAIAWHGVRAARGRNARSDRVKAREQVGCHAPLDRFA